MLNSNAVSMKITFFIVFLVLVLSSVSLCAETVLDPKITILVPVKVHIDESLQKEVDALSTEFREEIISAGKPPILSRFEPHIVKMLENHYDFVIKADFVKSISFRYVNIFETMMYYEEPTDIVLIRDEKLTEQSDLAAIAEKDSMQYVISFPEVKFTDTNGKKQLELTVKIYDKKQAKIVIDKTYTGDSVNNGGDISCDEGTLTCCVNNAIKASYDDFLEVLKTSSDFFIKKYGGGE